MERIEVVRKEVDAILLEQLNDEVRRNGYEHLYGVAPFSSILAVKRKLDVELCTIAGMFHDIYTYKFEYVKNHAQLGAIEAGNLLKGTGMFKSDEIEINHSDKNTKHNKYSELLKDADVLQNSFYNISLALKHPKRLKKAAKSLGIKM